VKSRPRSAPRSSLVAAVLGAVVLLAGACAKELPPPGAYPDQIPPRVERIEPAPDSIVVGFDGQLRIRFDEPVNIPNDLSRRLFASPMEPYQMETGFSDMRLKPRDGWREGFVYCLSIPEGISDLLRNRMEERIEFCFSTGPPITSTRVTGTISDAITGLPQNEARVVFLGPGELAAEEDSVDSEDRVFYGALTDSEGRFSAEALPPGEYQAFGFIDQNRNFTFQRETEAYDSATFTAAEGAIPDLDMSVVPPDTTPPVLLRAETMDGITIQLEFDDYLLNPPEALPQVVVRDSATNAEIEVVETHVGQITQVTFTTAEPTETDSAGLAQDSVAPSDEPAFVVPDSLFAPPEEQAVLPSRFVSVRVATRLDSATYVVQTSGVINVRHLVGGGDTTFVAEPPPPVPEPAPEVADSVGLGVEPLPPPPDTIVRSRRAASLGPPGRRRR